jgi:nitroreductase
MSLGAAVENICIATEAYGGKPRVEYTPEKEQAARISFTWPATWSSPNTEALEIILRRKTNRSDYKTEELDATSLPTSGFNPATITTSIIQDSAIRSEIGKLFSKADLLLMNKQFKKELATWVHHNWTNRPTGMPAGVQGLPGPVSLAAKFILSHAPIEKDQAKKDDRQVAHAPLLAIVSGVNDEPATWLEAGRVFERICLQATASGFDSAPLASIVEADETREALQKLLKTPNLPLALLRIGHATKSMPHAPRLKAEEVTSA